MTKDQIIQMAREAGFSLEPDCKHVYCSDEGEILRFAAAIRAATKEEDARICDELWDRGEIIADYINKGNDNDWCFDALEYIKLAAQNGTSECASSIRASK